MAVDGGAQQDRIMGGSAAVSERMAQALGDSVVLDSPVRTIRQLTQRLPAGSVIKTYLVDDRPFWRDRGLNGQAGSDEGPVKVTFDNTPPGYGRGVMMGFIEGADGREWARRTPEERRQVVIDCLVRYFGEEAARPLEYLERDWMAEEFSRGCYGAHFTTGAWTAYGPALTEPVGPIHWAGAECSPVWNGYMEGAVRSGEATAKAVLGELSGLAPRPATWPTGSSVVWNQGSTQRHRGSILATWK